MSNTLYKKNVFKQKHLKEVNQGKTRTHVYCIPKIVICKWKYDTKLYTMTDTQLWII